ncbi:MAG: hypothetical protein U0531_22220, partial [Dehalococcoidia bacterium]
MRGAVHRTHSSRRHRIAPSSVPPVCGSWQQERFAGGASLDGTVRVVGRALLQGAQLSFGRLCPRL